MSETSTLASAADPAPIPTRPHASPVRRRTPGSLVRTVIGYLLLCLVALAFLSPLIYMVATSFKPPAEVFSKPPRLIGSEFRWQNYAEVFEYAPFGRYLVNGLFVAIAGT